MFVDKEYGRSFYLQRMSATAAARLELRNARRIRRKPTEAAIVVAERILVANMDDS